uniref:Uncharacterized protein n=1 Tax=Pectinophora gossypiella TaxID=13191 RepID=A0A1E1W9J0_PECGO
MAEEKEKEKLSTLVAKRGYIKVLNQNDIEDFGKVEEIFYFSKAMLLDAIEKRNKNDSSSTPPPSTSSVNDRKLKLPAINIEIFDDGFTSRAFQLEREIGKEPTVAELLAFLEKRALAAENSPATASNWKPASRLAVNIAVQGSSCKKCAPAIYSDDEHTAAEPALVPAIEAAIVSAAEPAIVPAAAEPIAAA